MVARAHFSHKSLEGLNGNQKQEKLWQEKGINFNDFPVYLKRGSGCYKFLYSINEGTEQEAIRSIWKIDDSIPIFTQDRDYIEKFIERGCESNN
jgi:tRNA(His) 5'-end guanylyltransferase